MKLQVQWKKALLTATLVVIAPVPALTASTNSGAIKKPSSSTARARALMPAEAKLAIRSLMAQSAGEISKDPSCQADLASTKAMTLADAMAETLVRAATDDRRIALRAECFVRSDYPLKPGEEYCRVAWVPANAPKADSGYGLLFIMNWQTKAVAPQSIECY